MYCASKVYKILKCTIFKHVKKQRGVKSNTRGSPSALPYKVEKKNSENLKTMKKWEFGLSKKEVRKTISSYIKENNILTLFKDGVPGNNYFIRFKKQFGLSQKKP